MLFFAQQNKGSSCFKGSILETVLTGMGSQEELDEESPRALDTPALCIKLIREMYLDGEVADLTSESDIAGLANEETGAIIKKPRLNVGDSVQGVIFQRRNQNSNELWNGPNSRF